MGDPGGSRGVGEGEGDGFRGRPRGGILRVAVSVISQLKRRKRWAR